jgi:hypothetical protein
VTRQPISDAFFMIVGVPLLLLATLVVLIIFAPIAVWDKLTYKRRTR